MSYAEAIANLDAMIPELFVAPAGKTDGGAGGSAVPARRKFSLDEIGILMAALGNQHRRFPSVLIAGTNGKGSTAATLASIAAASGLRTGLYTSPHLDRVNERIRLDGKPISDEAFARDYFRVHDAARQLVLEGKLQGLPSYFELLTALAFVYFAEPEPGQAPVDLAILEVGMGGRLDATNLVDPMISVITDIALDHQEWLGNTIDLITREKAGILRENGVLVTLPQHPEANQALGEVAMRLDVRGVSASDYMPQLRAGSHEGALAPYAVEVMGESVLVDSPLHGAHQHRNLALAIAAAVELKTSFGFRITAASIAEGVRKTYWPGRLETVPASDFGPDGCSEIILDVAHNPAGAWALRAALRALDVNVPDVDGAGSGCLIFSCLRDKPLREMSQILFPIFDHVVLAPIQSGRATDMAELVAAAEATGVPSLAAASVAEAIALARSLKPRRIVISGSLFLVGEARSVLLRPRMLRSGLLGSSEQGQGQV